ncbi:MAG: GerMN domain-containing protein [Thermoleophilia bacterium]|nr:GerMN domain-containing protein [Thermoleophilia bacterium]
MKHVAYTYKVASVLFALALIAVGGLSAIACGAAPTEIGEAGTVSTTAVSASTTTTTEPAESTTSTEVGESTTSTTSAPTMTLKVYYSKDEKMFPVGRVVPKTLQVGATAMKALLEGPTAEEKAFGIVSNIPEGTTFLGLEIQDGIAIVDLSKEYASGGGTLSMMMRLAEVVFTLTQFPTVHGVTFKLDGQPIDVLGGEGIVIDHPMTRADYEDLSPAILIESPLYQSTVTSPVRVTGTANVFEATFHIDIVDCDGLILAEERVMATSGTGTRGTFDVTIPFKLKKAGPGSIIAFTYSPKDGSQTNIVELPVNLK